MAERCKLLQAGPQAAVQCSTYQDRPVGMLAMIAIRLPRPSSHHGGTICTSRGPYRENPPKSLIINLA